MKFLKEQRGLLLLLVPIMVGIISFFPLAHWASSPDFHRESIASLEEKEKTVLELTTASTAASALVTLLPGDVGTPIAEKLADVSSGFLIVLCALYLEKYLLTITGYAAFKVLIPLACALYAAYAVVAKEGFVRLARKLVVFSLAIFLLIPAGVKVSDLIEQTYEASIQATIDSAKDLSEDMEEITQQMPEGSEEKSWFQTMKDWTIHIGDTVKTTLSQWLKTAENTVSHLFEALAVMIVTCCLIPILVMLGFVWIFKMVCAVDLPVAKWLPSPWKRSTKRRETDEEMCVR